MYLQEQTLHAWSILALDCGLGKTITTLALILKANHAKIEHNALYPDDQKTYRASMVICPAGAIEIWYEDLKKFFPKGPLKIYQFYGTPKTIAPARLSSLIGTTTEELGAFLDGLDPADPQVGLLY